MKMNLTVKILLYTIACTLLSFLLLLLWSVTPYANVYVTYCEKEKANYFKFQEEFSAYSEFLLFFTYISQLVRLIGYL